MPRRFLSPLLLLLAALCWSLGGVLIKSIDWPPMAIAGGRSAIAIPIILLCVGRPTQSRIMGMAIALRPPAIAIGGQSIDLISTPPRLQQSAARRSRRGDKNRRGIGRA